MPEPSQNRARVRRHRDALRTRGLRPVQLWVPDMRSPRFAEEARRQSRLVSEAPEHWDDMDFLERISEFDEAGDGDAPR
jgi:hypothetical protein